jgi:ABC-type multidrug transport system fused ATPase/permease subunit
VDRDINRLMQSLIRGHFATHAVICVEHYLANILDYDKIPVSDAGSIIEFDSPDILLQTSSKFRQMVEA